MGRLKRVTLELEECEIRVLRYFLPLLCHCDDLKDDIAPCEKYLIDGVVEALGGQLHPMEEPLTDEECRKIEIMIRDKECRKRARDKHHKCCSEEEHECE